MIPHQIPYREVDHDFGIEQGEIGSLAIGECKHTVDWMTDEALEAWEIDMERRERRRAEIGGFGFGTHRL